MKDVTYKTEYGDISISWTADEWARLSGVVDKRESKGYSAQQEYRHLAAKTSYLPVVEKIQW